MCETRLLCCTLNDNACSDRCTRSSTGMDRRCVSQCAQLLYSRPGHNGYVSEWQQESQQHRTCGASFRLTSHHVCTFASRKAAMSTSATSIRPLQRTRPKLKALRSVTARLLSQPNVPPNLNLHNGANSTGDSMWKGAAVLVLQR